MSSINANNTAGYPNLPSHNGESASGEGDNVIPDWANHPSQDGETVQKLPGLPGLNGESASDEGDKVIPDWASNAGTVDCPVDLDPAILSKMPYA